MPRLVERRWEGNPCAPGGRKARQSFTYRAFIPDRISEIDPVVPFQTAAAASEAA